MQRVYIAGPFSSPNPQQMAAHVLTAQAAAVALAQIGVAPYCPHAALGYAYGLISEDVARQINESYLRDSDAMLLLPGWGNSKGTRDELALVRQLGIPKFRSVHEVAEWRRR